MSSISEKRAEAERHLQRLGIADFSKETDSIRNDPEVLDSVSLMWAAAIKDLRLNQAISEYNKQRGLEGSDLDGGLALMRQDVAALPPEQPVEPPPVQEDPVLQASPEPESQPPEPASLVQAQPEPEPEPVPEPEPEAQNIAAAASPPTAPQADPAIALAQARLRILGYNGQGGADVGAVDGLRGRMTNAALAQFAQDQGLSADAPLNAVLQKLEEQADSPQFKARMEAILSESKPGIPTQDARAVQTVLGVKADGLVGPKTRAAAEGAGLAVMVMAEMEVQEIKSQYVHTVVEVVDATIVSAADIRNGRQPPAPVEERSIGASPSSNPVVRNAEIVVGGGPHLSGEGGPFACAVCPPAETIPVQERNIEMRPLPALNI